MSTNNPQLPDADHTPFNGEFSGFSESEWRWIVKHMESELKERGHVRIPTITIGLTGVNQPIMMFKD